MFSYVYQEAMFGGCWPFNRRVGEWLGLLKPGQQAGAGSGYHGKSKQKGEQGGSCEAPRCAQMEAGGVFVGVFLQLLALSLTPVPLQNSCLELGW